MQRSKPATQDHDVHVVDLGVAHPRSVAQHCADVAGIRPYGVLGPAAFGREMPREVVERPRHRLGQLTRRVWRCVLSAHILTLHRHRHRVKHRNTLPAVSPRPAISA
jgi:hypothetical protein